MYDNNSRRAEHIINQNQKMARFGNLFSYESYEIHFSSVSYYDVTLTTEWSGFGIGYKIYRIDICMETGNYCFIDSNETTIKSGVM